MSNVPTGRSIQQASLAWVKTRLIPHPPMHRLPRYMSRTAGQTLMDRILEARLLGQDTVILDLDEATYLRETLEDLSWNFSDTATGKIEQTVLRTADLIPERLRRKPWHEKLDRQFKKRIPS